MNIKGERSGSMANEVSDLLTVDDLCEKLQISRNTAYQLLESGDVDGFKVGRNWRIPNVSISSYIVNQIRKRGIKNGYNR